MILTESDLVNILNMIWFAIGALSVSFIWVFLEWSDNAKIKRNENLIKNIINTIKKEKK